MVILLHSRTSAAFLAADLKQARADAVSAAANQAFVQRIGNLQGAGNGTGGRFPERSRTGWDSNPRYPCGHTGFRDRPFQPLTHLSTDRVGFEPTKRLPVYTLSRRVPSATRPPIQLLDA